jgi:hypothetical protein
MRPLNALFFLTVLGGALESHPAVACSSVELSTLVIDSTLATTDVTPPTTPGAVISTLTRRLGTQCASNGTCTSSTCGDTAELTLTFPVSIDDHSAADSIGYQLVAVRGQLPVELQMPRPVLAPEGSLMLEVAFDDAPKISTQAQLVAVDAAGNTSAPSAAFAVVFDGCTRPVEGETCVEESDHGCAMAAAAPSNGTPAGHAALGALIGLFVLSRRRHLTPQPEKSNEC